MEVTEMVDNKKVSEVFDNAFELFQTIEKGQESTSCPSLQSKVKGAIKTFEDITRTVSTLGMFSSNEAVEEVATEDLKFILLPAFLGSLTLRLNQKDRALHLDAAEIYFRDFLERCKEYGITNVKIPERTCEDEDSESKVVAASGASQSLTSMVLNRNEKLRRFKEQKDYEEHLEHLCKVTKADWSSNEEMRRDYILTLIRYWVNQSLEELQSIGMERPLVKHMEEMKSKGKKFHREKPDEARKPVPLQTVIITRDQVQKAVFGAGYPSTPIMTVDEFYEQRVKSGEFPDPCCRPKSLQDIASNGEESRDESDDEDNPKTEQQEDEELKRAREWDDHKDTHRRGWGNRHNRS